MDSLLKNFKEFGYSETPNKILIDNLADWLEEMLTKKEQGVVFPIGWDVDMREYYG